MLLESDRRRAQVIEEKLGSVVLNAPADEGRYQLEAGCQRADAVIAVTGEDPANLIICQLAKWKCNVPRVIARVNDPKNEIVFKALGIDQTIGPTCGRRSSARPRRGRPGRRWLGGTARRRRPCSA